MCLSNCYKLITDKDITCYKLFESIRNSENLQSIYFYYVWELNKLYETNAKFPKYNVFNDITGNAFHSVKSLEDAIKYKDIQHYYWKYDNLVICKCTIPKNSNFIYSGHTLIHNDLMIESFASEKLIINEIIQYPYNNKLIE